MSLLQEQQQQSNFIHTELPKKTEPQITSFVQHTSDDVKPTTSFRFTIPPELRILARKILHGKKGHGHKALTWNCLHAYADHYPLYIDEKLQKAIESHLYSLTEIFPCENCRDHLREYLLANPIQCKTRDDIKKYLYELHNAVNIRIGEPLLSYEEAMRIQTLNDDIDWTALVRLLKDLAYNNKQDMLIAIQKQNTENLIPKWLPWALLGVSGMALVYMYYKRT